MGVVLREFAASSASSAASWPHYGDLTAPYACNHASTALFVNITRCLLETFIVPATHGRYLESA